jgi:hypothetical protein
VAVSLWGSPIRAAREASAGFKVGALGKAALGRRRLCYAVVKNCGVAGTSVAAVDGRHFGAAGPAKAGAAVLQSAGCCGVAETAVATFGAAGTSVLRCGGDRCPGVWLTSVPLLERPLCKAFNCGQRSCDRLLPKLAADCDGAHRRRGACDAKANKHGTSAPKLGARSLISALRAAWGSSTCGSSCREGLSTGQRHPCRGLREPG